MDVRQFSFVWYLFIYTWTITFYSRHLVLTDFFFFEHKFDFLGCFWSLCVSYHSRSRGKSELFSTLNYFWSSSLPKNCLSFKKMPLISLLLKLKNCVFFDQRRFGYDHCGLFSANFGYFSTPAVFLVLLLWKFEQLLRKKCVISSLLVCNFSDFGCPLFYFCVNFCEKLRFW